jgi:hypothetical protein
MQALVLVLDAPALIGDFVFGFWADGTMEPDLQKFSTCPYNNTWHRSQNSWLSNHQMSRVCLRTANVAFRLGQSCTLTAARLCECRAGRLETRCRYLEPAY